MCSAQFDFTDEEIRTLKTDEQKTVQDWKADDIIKMSN